MSEKRFTDVTETPKEELECKKKYLYEHSRFWECNDGSKCQILEEDVCDLLNELNNEFEDCGKLLDRKDDFIHKFKKDIEELGISIKLFEDDIATKDKKIEEQQSTIQRMKHSLNTIYKAFEKHYGYDMRNAIWLIDELSYDDNEIGFDSDE